MDPKMGEFCKLYCDTGTSATPVWVEWGEIDGVTCSDLTRSSVELNVRALNCTPSIPGKIGALTFGFKYYPGFNDTNYAQLISDFFDEPVVRKWAMMNGDIEETGSQGLVMPAYVEGIPYDQSAGTVVSHSVTLKFGFLRQDNVVQDAYWYKVSA